MNQGVQIKDDSIKKGMGTERSSRRRVIEAPFFILDGRLGGWKRLCVKQQEKKKKDVVAQWTVAGLVAIHGISNGAAIPAHTVLPKPQTRH